MNQYLLSGLEQDILYEIFIKGNLTKREISAKSKIECKERLRLTDKLYALGFLDKIEDEDRIKYILSEKGRERATAYIDRTYKSLPISSLSVNEKLEFIKRATKKFLNIDMPEIVDYIRKTVPYVYGIGGLTQSNYSDIVDKLERDLEGISNKLDENPNSIKSKGDCEKDWKKDWKNLLNKLKEARKKLKKLDDKFELHDNSDKEGEEQNG